MTIDFQNILPKTETEYTAMVNLFANKSADLTTRFVKVFTQREIGLYLNTLATQEKWVSIASHHTPLTDESVIAVPVPCLWTDQGYKIEELEKVSASITGCDALIAQTGSVMLSSRTAGGRALSILPPHHIVLATKNQIVPDLPTAYRMIREKYSPNYPSMVSLVTGPSRTGDIERILVLGAHGPRKLTIILVEEV